MPELGIASHYKVTTAAERRAALRQAQEERRKKEASGCFSCLRGGGGGTGGAGKDTQRGKSKDKPPPKEVNSEAKKKGKSNRESRAEFDSDESLGSDSDEIDAEALMRKYGLDPDDGAFDDVEPEETKPRAVQFADEVGDSDEYETDTDEEEDKMDVIAEGDEEEEEAEEEEEQVVVAAVKAERSPLPGQKPKREKLPKSVKQEKKPKKAKKKLVAESPPWSMEVAPSADEIRADLQEMRLRPLKKRALAAGVTYEQLDEAEDEEDYHGTIIELVVAKETALTSSGGAGASGSGHGLSKIDPNEIRVELQKLRLKELKKRAKSMGVSSDELEDAEDEDDYKGAIVELIVARETAAVSGRDVAAPGFILGSASSPASGGATSPKAAAKLYDRARTLRRQGSYDVAILAYTDAISAEHPELAKCLNERGMCHGQLGQHAEAYEDYVAAIDLLDKPDASGAAVYYYNRGNAALQQGNVVECVQDLKKALQLQPGFAQAASALEELDAAVAAAEAAEAQQTLRSPGGDREPDPEPEQVPTGHQSQAAIDAAIAEALAKQQREMDETKKQLQATQEKLRAEQEYHQELSQAEKEAHAEALREAEERAAADEVMQRLAEEKAERRRAREQKREELAERERVDAAVAKQRVPSGRPPSMTRSKKGSGDMGNALEAEIQRLQGEKSRREIERKEERARREEDHRLRAEKKSRRQKARGTDSEEKVNREDGQDFGRDYKEKERQAVMAVKAAMAEKFAAQEETELAKLAEAEAAQKKKARTAERAAERAERERIAVEAYNTALREKNRSRGAQGGAAGSLEGRKLEGRKPVKGISARSSAALGALLRQRTGEG